MGKITIGCATCGKAVTYYPSAARKYCSRSCASRAAATNPTSVITRQRGTKARNAQEPVSLVCPTCHASFGVKPSHAKRRRYCSPACMAAAYTSTQTGENGPNWQGGGPTYYGPSWRTAQRLVRGRDKVCLHCGMTPEQNGRSLDIHHIVPFVAFGLARHSEANVLTNLMSLCRSCHSKADYARKQEQEHAR